MVRKAEVATVCTTLALGVGAGVLLFDDNVLDVATVEHTVRGPIPTPAETQIQGLTYEGLTDAKSQRGN
jgi:hypothetical protein